MLLEFHVPLPFCVDDPTIGYLYMVMDACRSATGGGEGVEWLQEEEYDNTDGHMTCDVPGYSPPKNKGVFTLKHYLIGSKLPSWFSNLLPKGNPIESQIHL